ncbi:MAG TPA: YfcE family phosphodiesterase [Verrucomicrobiales bacterium]|nr:metallophosphoesterase family protein [Verrucomicrobiota bacterium]HAH98787.1 YfcE family phosphodiesterase [Verrucomicrobiales bacterium]
MITVGIISDNHGDWTSQITESLAGVDAIIHAGDIGPYKYVLKMEGIAPTTAVLGNTDGDMPLDETAVVTLGEKKFLVKHIVNPHRLQVSLCERLKQIQPDVVIFGHTHEPFCETLGGILFLNPGSVTQPRGGYRPSMVRLTIDCGEMTPKFIEF